MRLHAFAVGVASTVLALRGEHQIVRAGSGSSRRRSRAPQPARPIRTSPHGRAALRTAASAGSPTAADGRCVRRGDEGALRTTPAASATTRPISPAASTSALYSSVDSLAADRDRWELILTKLKSGEMPPDDATSSVRRNRSTTLVTFLETEFARADASMKPDPGRVTRAAAEPGRVHEHDPRPARDRLPRRQELPHRRFRRGLRQHRRRPDRLAGADGEVPRRPPGGSPSGRLPPSRCRSRSKSSTACASRTCAGSIRATSRRRTASISTPTTS